MAKWGHSKKSTLNLKYNYCTQVVYVQEIREKSRTKNKTKIKFLIMNQWFSWSKLLNMEEWIFFVFEAPLKRVFDNPYCTQYYKNQGFKIDKLTYKVWTTHFLLIIFLQRKHFGEQNNNRNRIKHRRPRNFRNYLICWKSS